MGIAKWLVVVGAVAAATNVQAQDTEKTQAYIAPFAGYTHLRFNEGTVYQQNETLRVRRADVRRNSSASRCRWDSSPK